MATAALWATTILVLLHAAYPYILLTANVDDVQAIAKQMLTSPVVDQIGKIWRRASAQFNQRLKTPESRLNVQKRADDSSDSDGSSSNTDYRRGLVGESFRSQGRRVLNELTELSKNTGDYVESLRRLFNEFTKDT